MNTLLDFSAGLPSPAAIKAAGHAGVVCYLPKNPAGGSSSVHTITSGYYHALLAEGLEVNLVSEPVNRLLPFQGASAGAGEARWVQSVLRDLNIPARNVFFAHDIWESLSGAQLMAMRDYQRAAHSVLGSVAGAYAFAGPLQAFRGDGSAGKLWLTGSASSKFAGLHLYQRNYGQVVVDGITCDVSEVLIADHGQLPAPAGSQPTDPPKGDWFDMATEADLKKAVKEVMDAERESYAHRGFTWNNTYALDGMKQHIETQGGKLSDLQKDVADLKSVLAQVAAHFAGK